MQRFQKLVEERSRYRDRMSDDHYYEELEREREYRAYRARMRSP